MKRLRDTICETLSVIFGCVAAGCIISAAAVADPTPLILVCLGILMAVGSYLFSGNATV